MPTSTVSSVPTSSGSTITTDGSKSHQMKQKCNSIIVQFFHGRLSRPVVGYRLSPES